MAASENDEQQQLSDGFANSCYKIVLPILLQELITILRSVSTVVEHFYLLKMKLIAKVWETRTTYLKKKPGLLIDQPRTCRIFC